MTKGYYDKDNDNMRDSRQSESGKASIGKWNRDKKQLYLKNIDLL